MFQYEYALMIYCSLTSVVCTCNMTHIMSINQHGGQRAALWLVYGGMLCWQQVIKGKQDRVDNFPLYGAIGDILYQHMQIKICYDLFVCA